jgi:hypothetical protein
LQGAELEAIALSQMAASGNLSAAIRLAAIAHGRVAAAGGLSTAIRLGAAAQGVVSFDAMFAGQLQPTHYVTATATGSGNGTIASPYTLAQACALAQPGWRVQVAPGTYVGVNTTSNSIGSFQCATQGTQANPIVFYAQNFAALGSSNLSILENNATSQGSGCPVIGARGGHHWYGFYINENEAPTRPDTGPVWCGGQFNRFSYMRINRGDNVWPVAENNHAALRFEGNGCRNNVVSDCLIENYSGIGWNGSEQGIQIYGPTTTSPADYVGALTIENNVFFNCQFAVTSKSIVGRLIEGGVLFRRNLIMPSNYHVNGDVQSGGIHFIELGNQLGRSQVYQNIQVGGAVLAKMGRHFGYQARDVDVCNNTCISLVKNQDFSGVFASSGDGASSTGWRVHNNIKIGSANVRTFRYDAADTALQSCSHNFGFGSTNWAEHPDLTGDAAVRAGLRTLAQWVAGSVYDDFSSEANPLLLSTTWGDANLGRLQSGSPCRNAGIDVLSLNGGGTNAACHVGAYSRDDVVIGIRPVN